MKSESVIDSNWTLVDVLVKKVLLEQVLDVVLQFPVEDDAPVEEMQLGKYGIQSPSLHHTMLAMTGYQAKDQPTSKVDIFPEHHQSEDKTNNTPKYNRYE